MWGVMKDGPIVSHPNIPANKYGKIPKFVGGNSMPPVVPCISNGVASPTMSNMQRGECDRPEFKGDSTI